MHTESLTQPFDIVYKKIDVCPKPTHKHSFFELIYIVSGTGVQHINDNHFHYHAGHMFLLTPADAHSLDITTTTEFVFIRFTDIYVKSQVPGIRRDIEWINKLEYILNNATHQPGCILCNAPDKIVVKAMIESILGELSNQQLYHREIIAQIINTVIAIVARNIGMTLPERISSPSGSTHLVQIVNYIQQHIYDTDKLRLKVMADQLKVAGNYLSKHFKKETGETIQQYIINYKLKLVETRLQHSNMRINEIVSELGFTDESHLNRLFKKYKGLAPSTFRKRQRPATLEAAI